MDLEVQIQSYDWGKTGSSGYVAQLAKSINLRSSNRQEIYENLRYAELWMGTHPNGPSKLKRSDQSLSQFIEENPLTLGHRVLDKFGVQLPFLFKVLSIDKALSIQAHPNKEHAAELFKSRPDLYKDPNHKPELAIAITPFEALCGFRPVEEIKMFFQSVPELMTVVGAQNVSKFLVSDEAGLAKALQDCFKTLMTREPDFVSQQLQLLLDRIALLDESSRAFHLAPLVERLNQQFPNDVGCFVVYFLNYLKLSPGEAIFLGPNEPHAYLSGDCVECMACSDNVVRAGLTPKYKDVDTLCNMLTYRMEPVDTKILNPIKENDFTLLYTPPVEDFAVAQIKADESSTILELIPRLSASILIVLKGSGTSKFLPLFKGSVIFLPAYQTFKILNVSNDFILYQAFTNI